MKTANSIYLWPTLVFIQLVTMPLMIISHRLEAPLFIQHRREITETMRMLVTVEMPIPGILLLLVLLYIRPVYAIQSCQPLQRSGKTDHDLFLDMTLFATKYE
jgi:hypothetical protein